MKKILYSISVFFSLSLCAGGTLSTARAFPDVISAAQLRTEYGSLTYVEIEGVPVLQCRRVVPAGNSAAVQTLYFVATQEPGNFKFLGNYDMAKLVCLQLKAGFLITRS